MSERKRCRLAYTAHRVEECPEGACPFWQPGGAVLDGRCAIERVELRGPGELGVWLLGIRDQLESPDAEVEKNESRRLLDQLLSSAE